MRASLSLSTVCNRFGPTVLELGQSAPLACGLKRSSLNADGKAGGRVGDRLGKGQMAARRAGSEILEFFTAADGRVGLILSAQSRAERAQVVDLLDDVLRHHDKDAFGRSMRELHQREAGSLDSAERDRIGVVTRMLSYEYERRYGESSVAFERRRTRPNA